MIKLFLTQLVPLFVFGVLFGEKTAFDGDEPNSVGQTYLAFNGQTSLTYTTLLVNQLQEFTFVCWLRIDANSSATFIQTPDFNCTYSAVGLLTCGSLVSNYQMLNATWYIFMIQSRVGYSQVTIANHMVESLAQSNQSKSFPAGQPIKPAFVRIGNGLIGSIKNFQMFNKWLNSTELAIAPYTYLHPYSNLLMMIPLRTLNQNDTTDLATGLAPTIVGALAQQFDYSAKKFCYNQAYPLPQQDTLPHQFEVFPFVTLSAYVLTSANDLYSTTTSRYFTLRMWFKRLPPPQNQQEDLFIHDGVIRVYIINDRIGICPAGGPAMQYQVGIPYNQWLYLEAQVNFRQYGVTIISADQTIIFTSFINGWQDHGQQYQPKYNIWIAQQFSGIILSVQYRVDTSQPSRPPNQTVAIPPLQTFDQSVLIQFSFITSLRYQVFGFQNLAVKFQGSQTLPTQQIQATLNSVVVQSVWREPGGQLTSGYINQPAQFDGITCQANSQRPLLSSNQSSISSSFQTTQPITQFTVELWFKPTQANVNVTTLIQINGIGPLFQISKIGLNLVCYPLLPRNDSTSRVQFTNFQQNDFSWQHIACTYDASTQQITGVLYNSATGAQNIYTTLTNQTLNLPYQNFTLIVGNDQSYKNGYAGIFVQEVRIWSQALTPELITNNRFQNQPPGPNLLHYLKLTSQAKPEQAFGQTIQINQVAWQQNSEILICPLFTFSDKKVGSQLSYCYRDLYKSMNVLVLKNGKGDYQFVPSLTVQSGQNVLGSSIVSFIWQYLPMLANTSQVTPKVTSSPQLTQILNLTASQLPDRSQLNMSLSLQNPLMKPQKILIYVIADCVRFHDADTQLSWVFLDLHVTIGTQDIKLNFTAENCVSTTTTYNLVAVTFQVVNQPQVMGLLDPIMQTYTILAKTQSTLPINEYFSVIGSATFQNNGTQQFKLQIIYQLRFVSKLVVNLVATPQAVTIGQTLRIDSSSFQYMNIPVSQVPSLSFTRKWLCPSKLQQSCINSNAQLSVSFATFQQLGLQYWTPYTIQLVSTTNFIQGDGTTTSISSVVVMWVSLSAGDGVIKGDNLVDSNSNNVFTVDFNEEIELNISIVWAIQPLVPTFNLAQYNQRQISLPSGCLKPGTSYTLNASLVFKMSTNQLISSATAKFAVMPQPSGGSFSVAPSQGVALLSNFSLLAVNWSPSLTFQWFILPWDSVQVRPISELTSQSTLLTQLPACQAVLLRVYFTKNGSYSQQQFQVNVKFNSNTSYEASKSISFSQRQLVYLSIQDLNDTVNQLQVQKELVTKLPILQQQISLASMLSILERSSSVYKIYDRQTGRYLQQFFYNLVGAANFDQNLNLLKDREKVQLLLQIESNLLKGCEWLEISRQYSSWDPDQDIGNVTNSIRQVLTSFEQSYAQVMAEGDVLNITLPGFNYFQAKYSRMQPPNKDVMNNLGYKLAYKYPSSKACQYSVRQSLTLIGFLANPFLGSDYHNQTVISNSTLYSSYRDTYGYNLGSSCINSTLEATFYYQFTPFFVQDVTTCGAFTQQNGYFENRTCQTLINKQTNRFTCICKPQNNSAWFAVLEDYFVRPLPKAQNYDTFSDWSSFIALAYTCCVTLVGLLYSYSQDIQDFKHLRDLKFKRDSEMMQQRDLPLDLVSLAQKRQVGMIAYSDKFTTFRYFTLLLLHTHPILQLRYQLDPQLSKLNKFSVFAGRLWIAMVITFLLLGQANSNFTPVNIALIVVSIILIQLTLIPLPSVVYHRLRHRYMLRVSPNVPKVKSDTKQIKYVDEVVYECDTNMPIRFLFILNAMPLLKNSNEEVEGVKFASGDAEDLCQKLVEFQEEQKEGGSPEETPFESKNDEDVDASDIVEQSSEYITVEEGGDWQTESDEEQKTETNELSSSVTQTLESSETPRGQIQQRQAKRGHFMTTTESRQGKLGIFTTIDSLNNNTHQLTQQIQNLGEIKVKQNIDFDIINPKQFASTNELEKESEMDVTQNELVEKEEPEAKDSVSSIDSEVFEKEKKEFFESDFNMEAAAWLYGILGFLVLIFLVPAVYVFVKHKVYALRSNYIWVATFFCGQLISFAIVDPLICLLVALHVVRVRQQGNKQELMLVCRWLRESLIVYEDYIFSVSFQQSRFT